MSKSYFKNIYNFHFLIQMLKFATLMLHKSDLQTIEENHTHFPSSW